MGDVAGLVRYVMELVQTGNQFKSLKGSEKKALVLQVVEAVVKDILETEEVAEEAKSAILLAVDLAPYVIDATIDFAKVYSSTGGGGEGVKRAFCGCFGK